MAFYFCVGKWVKECVKKCVKKNFSQNNENKAFFKKLAEIIEAHGRFGTAQAGSPHPSHSLHTASALSRLLVSSIYFAK